MQQTIKFQVVNKVMRLAPDSLKEYLVSQNDDYAMQIDLDEQRTAMFAVFVRNGTGVSCTIDSDGYVLNEQGARKIPLWALSAPLMTVGVVSDGYATTPASYCVRGSIKDYYSTETPKPDDPLVEQLIRMVNDLQPGGGATFTTDETLTLSDGVLRVNTTNTASQDNTLPITGAAVYTVIGNIDALLETI